jgi:hypothetical protein
MEFIDWDWSDWGMVFLLAILQVGWYNIFFMSISIMVLKIFIKLKKIL